MASTVVFAGPPAPPLLTVSPSTSGAFDFGELSAGASQDFTVTNVGGRATRSITVSLIGTDAYAITADGCSATSLGPKKSCVITIGFTPGGPGAAAATLTVVGRKPPASVSLSLTGTGQASSIVVTTPTYPCGGTCWGHVVATGLAPNAEIDLGVGTAVADLDGNWEGDLYLSCGSGWTGIHATSTTWDNQPITSNFVDSPCDSSIVVTAPTYPCGGTCWGHVVARSLAPNAEIDLGVGTAVADLDGNWEGDLYLSCGSGWTGIHATSTTWDNQPITSNFVDSPCG